MNVLFVFCCLCAATVAGFALVRLFSRDLSAAETLAWSFAAGLLVEAVIELALLAAHLRPGPMSVLLAEAALVAVSLLSKRPVFSNVPARAPATGGPLVPALLVLSAAGILLFLGIAVSVPMSSVDYAAIWGLKGRTIFATASIPSRLFHDETLAWAHPEYPLLVPLTLAALAAAGGAWDDQALALLYPCCQAATVLALFGFLARHVSKEAGAWAGCVAALCFPLYRSANVGLAEIPLALGLVLAASAAADAEASAGSRDARFRLALASLFCASAKQEGALFALLLALCLLVRRKGARGGPGLWLFAAVPPLVHESMMRLLRGPVARRDFDMSLLAPGRWGELASRAGEVLTRIVTVEARHAAVGIAAILLFLLVTRRGFVDWLALPLAAQVAVYAGLGVLSAFGPIWLVDTSFTRITVALVPVLALLLASRLAPPGRFLPGGTGPSA